MNTENVKSAVITSVFIKSVLVLLLSTQLLACILLDGAASLVGGSSREARNEAEGASTVCSRGDLNINKARHKA